MTNGTTAVDQGIGQRIIVVGSSGAGKSTLGQRLAEHLGVPLIELDALYWEPGWVEADREVFQERVRRAIEPESWVMAGNYTRQQLNVSWPRADTVVWLDLPLAIVLRRCWGRIWRRWRTREQLWGTSNQENVWEHLMLWNPKKSLIAYTITTHRRRRRTFEAAADDPSYAHISFVRLNSVADVDCWLTLVTTSQSTERAIDIESN